MFIDLEETKARIDCAGEAQQQFNRPTELVESICSWDRKQFGNSEEGERPLLEAVTRRLVTEDTADWEDLNMCSSEL
jgi:hypothetical protein